MFDLKILKRRIARLEREYDRVSLSREVHEFFRNGASPHCISYKPLYTFKEVGEFFGVSSDRISQIESSTIKKLKYPRMAMQLRHLLFDVAYRRDPIIDSAFYSERREIRHLASDGSVIWGSPKYDLYKGR